MNTSAPVGSSGSRRQGAIAGAEVVAQQDNDKSRAALCLIPNAGGKGHVYLLVKFKKGDDGAVACRDASVAKPAFADKTQTLKKNAEAKDVGSGWRAKRVDGAAGQNAAIQLHHAALNVTLTISKDKETVRLVEEQKGSPRGASPSSSPNRAIQFTEPDDVLALSPPKPPTRAATLPAAALRPRAGGNERKQPPNQLSSSSLHSDPGGLSGARSGGDARGAPFMTTSDGYKTAAKEKRAHAGRCRQQAAEYLEKAKDQSDSFKQAAARQAQRLEQRAVDFEKDAKDLLLNAARLSLAARKLSQHEE